MERYSKRLAVAAPVVLMTLIAFAACASDPHKLKVTEQNKNSFMESIKDSKAFTVDEVRMLVAYQMRNAVAGVFGADQSSAVGKTLGQIIDEERHFEEKQKKDLQSQERLADETRAKEEARAAELRKAINLSVYAKSFRESDPMAGSYEDLIVLKCAYENTSGRDIRAFRGKLRFNDLFGSKIYESGLTVSDPVSAGAKATWVGSIKYNQFLEPDVKFRNTDLKDMRVEWLPISIIFADGAQIGEH
jgi:hypothetical protein